MKFDKVVIVCASLQQRVAKTAYCLQQMGCDIVVLGENITVSNEFSKYLQKIPFVEIPVIDKLKRTPLGGKRRAFLREQIAAAERDAKRLLVLARDVNYGYIVSKIVKKMQSKKIVLVTDVADNYDLLYKSYGNPLKKAVIYCGFRCLTRTSFRNSDGIMVVTPVNKTRIEESYRDLLNGKPVIVQRNLPLKFDFFDTRDRMENSFVYVGKIDEISRDPMYILDKLKDMPGFSLHFYSNEKKSTIASIKSKAEEYGIADRVVFHDKVSYDELSSAISHYRYGLVPHKRSPLTDYTVPNKMYDYKSAGLVTVMSDCPSLISENDTFGFGLVYSREKDDFIEVVDKASSYKLDTGIKIPVWQEEFDKSIETLEQI